MDLDKEFKRKIKTDKHLKKIFDDIDDIPNRQKKEFKKHSIRKPLVE